MRECTTEEQTTVTENNAFISSPRTAMSPSSLPPPIPVLGIKHVRHAGATAVTRSAVRDPTTRINSSVPRLESVQTGTGSSTTAILWKGRIILRH
ncbi:hypothetical protein MPDQ_006033 [Monascus purpureus]|uniref:Uncharacterized protein n=1 Tax=Monascus purpureus TaxID=5098 RepID=A0A507QV78_MONPU|nr:hypothetical protein MPDQ_006033 [Monascus purpureus]